MRDFLVTHRTVPWSYGKNHLTYAFRLFLATWGKRMSWKETAGVVSTSRDSVYRAIQWVVHWGIVHRELNGIESIGIDEIQHRHGHRYLTLVYQLDQGCKTEPQTVKSNRRKNKPNQHP